MALLDGGFSSIHSLCPCASGLPHVRSWVGALRVVPSLRRVGSAGPGSVRVNSMIFCATGSIVEERFVPMGVLGMGDAAMRLQLLGRFSASVDDSLWSRLSLTQVTCVRRLLERRTRVSSRTPISSVSPDPVSSRLGTISRLVFQPRRPVTT